jgi:hypothetical protein
MNTGAGSRNGRTGAPNLPVILPGDGARAGPRMGRIDHCRSLPASPWMVLMTQLLSNARSRLLAMLPSADAQAASCYYGYEVCRYHQRYINYCCLGVVNGRIMYVCHLVDYGGC